MERKRFSLNKDWFFHLGDIKNKEEVSHGIIYSTAKAGACQGVPQADYDVSGWNHVDLPHDWSIHMPFDEKGVADWGYKSRGKAWYRRSFALHEEAKDKKIVLGFEGIATRCTVYLNGTEIYQNHSGYTPFEMDITDFVYFGNVPNILAVFVDASMWEGWWYEGAGIYRNVWLEMVNPIHIVKDSVFVHPQENEDGSYTVQVEAEICDTTSVLKANQIESNDISWCQSDYITSFFMTNPSGERKRIWQTQKYTGCRTEMGNAILKVTGAFTEEHPMLWDVDSPNLYEVEVIVAVDDKEMDSVHTVCGFRTIEMDAEKGFFLNHKPLKLFGTCNHQDFGGLGVAVPSNLWEYRIEKLKAMGSNAYRCAHGMPADELLTACDHLGMLVMDENRNFNTSKEGLLQLEKLVRRHRNHPSVIMYSIFNEEPLEGTLQGMRMAKRMKRTIAELDSSRLITGAMHGGMLEEENAAVALDVAGVNYQIGIYDAFHDKNPSMPMVGTETTSTFSIRGCYETDADKNLLSCYDDNPADWGNTVRDTWKAIMERDFMAGGFMWTGFDYLGEPTPHVWPSVSSFFGLMDTCGFEKDGFYLAKAIFSKEPVCHVLPHWNHKGKEGQLIRVMSHTNCEEVELFVNGASFGRKNVDIFTQVEWQVPYEAGSIELVGYRDGKVVANDVQKTTGNLAGIQVSPWKSKVCANGEDAMPIMIEAVDKDGNVIPDAKFMTRITVVGGKVLGTCNGDPNCHEPFDGNSRSIFNGKCMAIVRPDSDAKEIEVTVSAYNEIPESEIARYKQVERQQNDTGINGHFCSTDEGVLVGSARVQVVHTKVLADMPSIQELYLTNWKISPLYEERPDVWQKLQDYDMNSWQNVHVDKENGSPALFEDARGKYAIYQLQINIPENVNGHLPELYFYSIWGECEVYINGKKRDAFSYEWAIPHSLMLTQEDCGKAEIRILVKCKNIGAGLNSLVVLR